MTADELRARLARPASVGVVGGFRPPEDPRASWLGQVRVVGDGEGWPAGMAGVCQVNVGELPFVPDALGDVALLSLFVDPDADRWEVRAYPSLDGLVPIDGVVLPGVRPFPVRWERLDGDVPGWDDACLVLPPEDVDAWLGRYYDVMGHSADGLKVGGWPSLVQASISWDAEYVMQVDSDAKTGVGFGHGGVAYIGRGDGWAVAWQSL